MVVEAERRSFKRIAVCFDVFCRKVDSASDSRVYDGHTLNVSTGGLCFETVSRAFEPGNFVKIKMTVPPTNGLLEMGGAVSSLGRVLRASDIPAPTGRDIPPAVKQKVALEFCSPPALCS